MHNLTAYSLGLPGTPLHGLNDFEPRSRSTSARLGTGPGSHHAPAARARRRPPQAKRGRRFVARVVRPAPGPVAALGALLRQRA